MKKLNIILTIIAILVWGLFFRLTAQISMNTGFTEIADRLDGNTLTWSAGYTQMFGKVGAKANYRQVMVLGLSYDAVDLMGIYRLDDGAYRLDMGVGASWNDVNYKIDPIASIKNYFRIDRQKGIFLTADLETVFREKFIAHFLFGISIDIKNRR